MKDLNLAVKATLTWIRLVKGFAMQRLVLLDREFRLLQLHVNSIPLAHALAKFKCLFELISRVQIENGSLWSDLGQHVNDRHSFGAKRCCHRETRRKPIDRPLQDLLRGSQFQIVAGLL